MTRPDPAADSSADPPTAEALLAACAAQDRDAFQALYRRYSPAAYGLALRVLRDEQLAQDALQETFAQVWFDAGRFDPAMGSGRGWILRLAHRRAVDRVRREEADRRRGLAWGTGQLEPDHDAVAEVVELRSDHRRVRAALTALTPLQREALDLAYRRGMTQSQIAEHLGIPLGTAKTRLRDGLHRLRDELEVTRD
jgi:RNA polymerase sigma-70 factor (ECF subfamily)